MKNGLSSNYCYDVLQDRKGYMWIATFNGLTRFNGTNWQYFRQQRPKHHTLPANWVTDIEEDRKGHIWINTDGGVAVYYPETDSLLSFKEPVKGWGKISPVTENELIISSWTGLDQYKVNGSNLNIIQHYKESERNSFPCIFKDANGGIWSCPEDNPSLIYVNSKTKTLIYRDSIYLEGKPQQIIITSISSFSKDTLLLCTKNKGILKYAVKSNTASCFFNPSPEKEITFTCATLYQIKNETFLFAGTSTQGLYCKSISSGKTWQFRADHNNPGSILSDHVTTLCSDNNAGLWAGTSMGLSFFHPSAQNTRFYYFYNNPVIPAGSVFNCVQPIDEYTFLIGTEHHGLFLHSALNKTTQLLSRPPQFKHGRINAIEPSGKDFLIAGDDGLFLFSTEHRSLHPFLTGKQHFSEKTIKAKILSEQLTGICTFNGLVIYNHRENKFVFDERVNNKADTEKKICKDVLLYRDKLWVLRFFNGWDVYEWPSLKHLYSAPDTLLAKPIDYHSLARCSSEVVIASSRGLFLCDINHPEKFRWLKTQDGLEGDEIENCSTADGTNLYYTTPEGLYRYAIHQKQSSRICTYENYPQKWFNQLTFSTNQLLIGTVSNYFLVHAPRLKFMNPLTPSLTPEYILINGKKRLTVTDTFFLDYKENNISLFMGALSFPDATRNKWLYQLNYPDTTPVEISDGQIKLFNLPPFHYELKIWSFNSQGKRSEKTKHLHFFIKEPFYTTWQFWLLLLIGVSGIVAAFIFYRYKQHQRLTRIRNQISRDLHDELGANVSSIHIMARMLIEKQKQHPEPALENISRYSVQINDTINDIIWNINPQFDSLQELCKRMARFASETLEAAQLHYTLDLPEQFPDRILDNRIKYHLYLIFKEAVNNTAKYSGANNVNIVIETSERYFAFKLKDNGCGFDELAPVKGNGIHNMKSRAKEINAYLSITSESGKGTTIQLNIKL